ncbi:hypothetical protein QZH41_012209 [Actinostola sp. cb2023]|nr:hypothetical protein QZH41_012209 [Actinostola sp. cb2023]
MRSSFAKGVFSSKKDAKEIGSDDEIEGGDGSGGSSSSEDEGAIHKNKGVSGIIEVDNPNRVQSKMKKATDIEANAAAPTELSRREREEIAKQQEKIRFQKLHAEGKTDQAKADLARLAIIRREREEAAKKREEVKKG